MIVAKRIIKIGGYVVPCADVDEERKSSVVRHEYPGHNGADLESLGWKATEHKLRATFSSSQLPEWDGIKGVLKNGSSAVLEHWEYGDIDVHIESVHIKYDHRINTVEVDFSVIEDGIDKTVTIRVSAKDVAAGKAQLLATTAADICAKQFYPGAVPAPDLNDPNWLEKLGDLGSKANALVRSLRTDTQRLDGLIASVTYPVSASLNALEFVAELPGQLGLRLATVMDLMQGRVAGSPDPATMANHFLRDLDALVATFNGTASEGSAKILAASQAAQTVASVMASDEDRLRAMQAYETNTAFDDSGRWVAQAASPKSLPATATQMENLVGRARQIIQAARTWVDDPADLDVLALSLQDQYRDRLIQFEQIREITVVTPTPLHLVCHQNGLPYNTAERIALLNPQIKNPTFAQGRILIYAS